MEDFLLAVSKVLFLLTGMAMPFVMFYIMYEDKQIKGKRVKSEDGKIYGQADQWIYRPYFWGITKSLRVLTNKEEEFTDRYYWITWKGVRTTIETRKRKIVYYIPVNQVKILD